MTVTLPLVFAMAMGAASPIAAQPQSKLVSGLDKQTVQAIWCSSLFFENSFFFDEGSDEALNYEDMAFDLGERIDTILRDDHNLRKEEIDEIWSLFDDGAYALNVDDQASFDAQLQTCENGYAALL
ncbi:hypothetical protein DVH29_07305 [Pelagibacterium lacus]|uniref:Uncharacterized protein n=1 Tax=Pelagibacterium lacus TaxID=2282655 RepID=A0A369W5G0_9HYPH|nr:hypothetical protein DVH29_07305 [Pelagibacterium lacus]